MGPSPELKQYIVLITAFAIISAGILPKVSAYRPDRRRPVVAPQQKAQDRRRTAAGPRPDWNATTGSRAKVLQDTTQAEEQQLMAAWLNEELEMDSAGSSLQERNIDAKLGCKNDDDCVEDPENKKCGGKAPNMMCVQCLSDVECQRNPQKKKCGVNLQGKMQNKCVRCLSSDDCPKARGEKCNTKTGACVQCLSSADCPFQGKGDNHHCKRSTSTCVRCLKDADCSGRQVCMSNKCGCRESSHCKDSGKDLGTWCNNQTQRCGCSKDEDCNQNADFKKRCNKEKNTCVRCLGHRDCEGKKSKLRKCNDLTNRCVQCLEDDHCSASNSSRACLPSHQCGCLTDDHCDPAGVDKRCNNQTHECVQCMDWTDCDQGTRKKYCSPGKKKTCVECLTKENCEKYSKCFKHGCIKQ